MKKDLLTNCPTNTFIKSEEGGTIEGFKDKMDVQSCRICLLEGTSKQDENMISPCKCEGSLKYVHESCIKEWVLKKLNKKIQRKNSFPCQICKSPIKFISQKKRQCNNCNRIKRRVENHKIMVIFLIATMILALAVITILLVFTLGGRIDFGKEQKDAIEIVAIIGFVVLSIFLIIGTLFFIDRFLTTKRAFLVRFEDNSSSENEVNDLQK